MHKFKSTLTNLRLHTFKLWLVDWTELKFKVEFRQREIKNRCNNAVLKKGHNDVSQQSPFPSFSPISLSLRWKALWATQKISSSARTHMHAHTYTCSIKSQTHAKHGCGKPESWKGTFCYSKNTFEVTCGRERPNSFLFSFTHWGGCTQTHVGTHAHLHKHTQAFMFTTDKHH